LLALGTPAAKVAVVPNSPSLVRFDPSSHPDRPFRADDTLRLVYAGGLSPIYELDVVIDAIALIRSSRSTIDVRLDVYGRDFGEVPLRERAEALGIGGRVTLHGRIPLEDVPAAVAAADIGLAPTRRSRFTDYSLSTKVFEYAAMGKPVVASRLPMVERTFGPDTVVTYEPGNADDLAAAILRLADNAADRAARVERTLVRVRQLSWDRAGLDYVALVERLIALRSRPTDA
ncbi:MAG TPA: glycosyltransferase, partial [Candidatus Limnocylindrales bacterium]|nr:glycosyltransferase [Candidatus Limnocylindrales bacterium]